MKREPIVVTDPPELLLAAERLIAVLEDLEYMLPGLSVSSFCQGISYAELKAAVALAKTQKTTPPSGN